MTIRPLRKAEVASLASALAPLPLLTRYGRGAARLEADLTAALTRGDGMLVAIGPAGPVGLCWFLRKGTLAMGGYLRLIALAPGITGGGLGAQLLEAFEAEAARESRHAFLLVSDFNEGAQRFYERHGYRKVGELPDLVIPGVAEWLYWKRLPEAGPPGRS
jgi:ribosomal protein S18 acetylase RimI-like enzyme